MSQALGTAFRDEEFTGTARLFPVRDLVVFPGVLQALRVDEGRQRRLLADALSTDSLITLATVLPGKGGGGVISSAVCLARVDSKRQLADGTVEILVLGLRRAVVARPVSLTKGYREAEIELLGEVTTTPSKSAKLCLQLATRAREALSGWPGGEPLQRALLEQRDLAVMTDLLAYWLPLTLPQKLRLLREPVIVRRVAFLLSHLRRMSRAALTCPPSESPFPPAFSFN